MQGRQSVWPALLSALVGSGLLIAGLVLPWVDDRSGSELPWRSAHPWDLSQPVASSALVSLALPLGLLAGLCIIAIIVRVRGLAIALGIVLLGLEIAWFASESFRRTRGDLLVSQLEVGAWLALGGAVLIVIGAFLTPRWEQQVR